jgi:diguanylate cyclase (GGDEF)-like protein/PAS domain S-box-containing protein
MNETSSSNDSGVFESTDPSFLSRILDNVSDGVYFVDTERTIIYWNKGSEAISGFGSASVVGSHCCENILGHFDKEGKRLCHDGCPLTASMADGEERNAEVLLHHRDGHRVPVTVRAVPVKNERGEVVGAVETFRDDTARVEALERAQQMEEMAFLDALTRVGNRRFAEFTIAERLSEWKRHKWSFALLFIDIDNFKQINDEYGHAVGDLVLTMVARTIQGVARTHDFIGRWGGEEFVMIVTGADEPGLLSAAERVRSLVENSGLRTAKGEIAVTVSIGATIPKPGDSIESIIDRADERMFRSKAAGKNCVTV